VKRKHRHELKQNDFLVWLEQAMEWLEENKKNLVTAGVVVVTAAVLFGGINYYRSSRAGSAQTLLNDALEIFHTPVQDASARESSAVQPSPDQDFETNEERFRAALAAFEKVIEDYSGTDQGRQARYYAALCHKGVEELDKASALLEEVTGHRDKDLLYYLASQVIAVVKAEKGDLDGAAETYRVMVEDPDTPLPKDQLLYNLARLKEQAGNLEEARLNYQRVLDEYPDSSLRTEVTQRNDLIEYRLQS
jgi:tetratricopeptide (TPR) repeat protein